MHTRGSVHSIKIHILNDLIRRKKYYFGKAPFSYVTNESRISSWWAEIPMEFHENVKKNILKRFSKSYEAYKNHYRNWHQSTWAAYAEHTIFIDCVSITACIKNTIQIKQIDPEKCIFHAINQFNRIFIRIQWNQFNGFVK